MKRRTPTASSSRAAFDAGMRRAKALFDAGQIQESLDLIDRLHGAADEGASSRGVRAGR